MNSLSTSLAVFFSFKAYVMLPVIMLIIALAARVPLKRALFSAIMLAAGFAGVFIAFDFFVANISPAVQQLSRVRGLNFPVLDVGWPPLAAITWASPLAAISIPLVLILNLLMVATGLTRTVYIDIWNYWHFALMGALVMTLSDNLWLGLSAALVLAVYCFKVTEWTAPDVLRETGLEGISASPISVNGLAPYSACVDWLFDRIPVISQINYNPEHRARQRTDPGEVDLLDLLSEPMVIGLLMGLALAAAAGYDLKNTLELGVHVSAVMFLLPRSAGLIGEAMTPITTALRDRITRHFPKRNNLIVAIDTGFLMHHKSVVVTGLLLMMLAIVVALLLPGNRVLPLGDLPNLISVMSISVLMFRGNVFRAVLAGLPVIVTFLWISSTMAPLYTTLAQQSKAFNTRDLGLITAFTDGGHQLRFFLYSLYRGDQWTLAGLVAVIGSSYVLWRRFVLLSKPVTEHASASSP